MNNFYYNQQIKRYLVQFMYLFGGMQVEVGANSTREAGLIDVPVFYSSMDKVAASIAAGNTSNKPIRIPAMSASLSGLRREQIIPGLNQEYAETYLPAGAFFANETKTLKRIRPMIYRATMSLNIWTSNLDQHFQILEQILTVFTPSIQIQTSDANMDWSKITTVELVDVRYSETYPINTQVRVPMTELTFEMPIYLSVPAERRDDFVRDILIRIAAVDGDLPSDLVSQFDEEGIDYVNIASADDILAKAQILDAN